MFFRKDKINISEKKQGIDRNGKNNGKKEWEKCSHANEIKIKERKRSHGKLWLLFTPMNRRIRILSGKASLCTSFRKLRKASLAVETAMVLPMFFLGIVTIISFMDVYKLQTEHFMQLCEKTKEAGMYAYVLNGSGREEITLYDVYSYEAPGGIISLPKIWMHNKIKVHAWTGKEYDAFENDTAEDEIMVYVTDSGEVYHRKINCSYLSVSVSQVGGSSIASMTNTYGEKYEACEICSKNQKPAGTVYITKKGNRYHNWESCSGLKRTVRMVKLSEAEGLTACRRCG